MKKLLTLMALMCSLSLYSQNKDDIYKKALLEYNQKIVKHFFEGIEQKDYELVRTIFDLNARLISSSTNLNTSDTVNGREDIGKYFERLHRQYTSIRFEKEISVLNEGKELIVRYAGTFNDSSGQQFKSHSFVTFKLVNGKITEYVEYSNTPLMAKGKDENK